MGLKILVIGSGGREHTIAQKFKESPLVSRVFCAKGNPGMKRDGIELVEIAEEDHQGLIQFASQENIDWTFVGPEVPLLNGIVDDFEAAGQKIVGPRKAAAMGEGSKDFAKQLMNKYDIPTAQHQTFFDFDKAKAYVEKRGAPIVIKADGLAAGKGVVVSETVDQAVAALEEMLQNNRFGESGSKVVVEDFLAGEEFSLLAFVRGEEVYPMTVALDHKRAFDGDRGPNTGGMGGYSPVPQISEALIQEAIERGLKPAASGLGNDGCTFNGILYAGLIATTEGPKVIEFNARFGDPETQVVLQRLDSDLVQVVDDLLSGKVPELHWKTSGFSIGVVVAADGYPQDYLTGRPIPEFSSPAESRVYYAGVTEKDGQLVTNGGRVYLVEAQGETLQEAQEKVYQLLDSVDTSGTFYRRDIGAKALT